MRSGTIAIVGAGCGGVFVATQLLMHRQRAVDIVLIDPSPALGRGLAYRTDRPYHRLNTRARDMSAFSESPLDFVQWAAHNGESIGPDDFAPRGLYGAYLGDLLRRASAYAHPWSGIEVVHKRVEAIVLRDHPEPPILLGLSDGGHLEAEEVVLALGPPKPGVPWTRPPRDKPYDTLVEDPWQAGALASVPDDARVLLVGTGLTMVDVALELAETGRRQLYARSRHGLLPLAQIESPSTPVDLGAPIGASSDARALVHWARMEVAHAAESGRDWRDVLAAVRLDADRLWQSLPAKEQARLLRHALRYWEIHRHRMAPEVGRQLAGLVGDGRLNLGRGRVAQLHEDHEQFRVEIRHKRGLEHLAVDAVVNCTGPSREYVTSVPLAAQLVATGLARPGRHGLGLEVDRDGDLVDELGTMGHALHTVGWARRGTLIETGSVPELRGQAEALRRRLCEPAIATAGFPSRVTA